MTHDHGGDVYTFKKRPLDFSTGVNPLGMPLEAMEALQEDFSSYPDPHCRSLAAALSENLRIPKEWLLFGNGAADLIWRIVLSLKPKKSLLIEPSFSEYRLALIFMGCEIQTHFLLEERSFSLSDKILAEISPDLDLIFICNPNNPTGNAHNPALLEEISGLAKKYEIFLVVDECYLPFSGLPSCVRLLENPWVAALGAFTKTYALAGLRLGYMLSSCESLLEGVYSSGPCWSVSSAAQAAGEACLGASGFLEKSAAYVKGEREWLDLRLRELGLQVFPSVSSFLLAKAPKGLCQGLLEKGILVRDCGSFPGLDSSYIRIGAKKREQNETLCKAIQEVLWEKR
jgi:threonine-phosphate decarboxylase